MTPRENFLACMAQQPHEWMPVFDRPERWNIGFMDSFEKGPPGGGYDGFGVEWLWTSDGATPATDRFVLTDITKWREQVRFPELDAIDWGAKAARELAGYEYDRGCIDYSMGNGPFERMLALMGHEECCYAFYDEPEACHEFLNAWVDYRIKHIDIVAKYYKPDFIEIFDDVAHERGLFISPELYREFIKPVHKRCNDAIRAYGIKPIQHCCGLARDIIEDFIEEGAVAWSSVQPENDLVDLLKKYGGRITLIGGYMTNGPHSFPGAPEEMRMEEMKRTIDRYAPYGSYMISNLVYNAPTLEETIALSAKMSEEARKYAKDYYIKS